MLLIICILGSVNIFNFLGLQEPSWWTWCIRNKMYSCVMIFFVCNAVEGQLLSTGAFEISLNGKEMHRNVLKPYVFIILSFPATAPVSVFYVYFTVTAQII